jgi:hypothetical protein
MVLSLGLLGFGASWPCFQVPVEIGKQRFGMIKNEYEGVRLFNRCLVRQSEVKDSQ